MRTRRWADMSGRKRLLVTLLSAVQLTLAVAAWADLARRPAVQINGPKRRWASLIAINWVGPVLYFWRGRRPASAAIAIGR